MNGAQDIDADDGWRDVFKRQLDAIAERQSEMDVRLEQNTRTTERIAESTEELVDVMNSFKGAMAAMDIIGKFLKPFAFISSITIAAITSWFTIKGK